MDYANDDNWEDCLRGFVTSTTRTSAERDMMATKTIPFPIRKALHGCIIYVDFNFERFKLLKQMVCFIGQNSVLTLKGEWLGRDLFGLLFEVYSQTILKDHTNTRKELSNFFAHASIAGMFSQKKIKNLRKEVNRREQTNR